MKKYVTPEEKAEAIRANTARYREKNREENKEKISEYSKARYRKIKTEHNAQMKLWRENNKSKMAFYTASYLASRKQRTPPWLSVEQREEIKDWYYAAEQLSRIFPWGVHVDHVVPMRGDNVSGLHVPWNLQLLPATVNISKSNSWEIS